MNETLKDLFGWWIAVVEIPGDLGAVLDDLEWTARL